MDVSLTLPLAGHLPRPDAPHGPGAEGRRPSSISDEARARIEQTARDFEALTLQHLLAPMFQSVETPAIAGGGQHEETFGTLLQEEYAKAIAAGGGVGIADQIIDAMIALQSSQAPTSF